MMINNEVWQQPDFNHVPLVGEAYGAYALLIEVFRHCTVFSFSTAIRLKRKSKGFPRILFSCAPAPKAEECFHFQMMHFASAAAQASLTQRMFQYFYQV